MAFLGLSTSWTAGWSSYSAVCLVLLLAGGLFHLPADARPKNADTPAADDLTEEWKETADWIAADDVTDDSDSWRAFPRNIVKSSSRWWEGKLDDNVWNDDSYEDDLIDEDDDEEEISKYDNNVDENDQQQRPVLDIVDDNIDDDKMAPGENRVSAPVSTNNNANDNNNDDVDISSDSNQSSTNNNEDDDDDDDGNASIESEFVPSGNGLNSFVDQKSLSSYFGDEFNKKPSSWSVIDDNLGGDDDNDDDKDDDDSSSKGDDNRYNKYVDTIKEGGDPGVSSSVGDDENNDVSDEVQILDEPEAIDLLGDKKDELNDANDNDEEKMNGDNDDDDKLLGNEVALDIDEEIPDESNMEDQDDDGDEDDNGDNNGLTDDVDFLVPAVNKRGDLVKEKSDDDDNDVKEKEEKRNNDAVVKSDSIKPGFGDEKEDKLSGSEDRLQNWKQSEMDAKKEGVKEDEVKEDVEFEDWADWDDSVFDDYDKEGDDEGDDDEEKNVEISDDNDNDVDDDENDDDDDDDADWSSEESDDDDDDDDSSDDDDDDYDSDEDDEDESDEEEDDDDDYDSSEEEEDDDEDADDSNESEYYDDEEEDDDDDGNDEEEDTSNSQQQQPPPQPQSYKSSSPTHQAIVDEDIESYMSSVKDQSHYSKGQIYDSSHPFKKSKPSIKKDLGGPNHSKLSKHSFTIPDNPQEIHIRKIGDADIENDNEKKDTKLKANVLVAAKKISSPDGVSEDIIGHHQNDQQQNDERMSTGLESLTSPNPAPTVTTWTDTSLPSLSPSPSPSPPPSSSPSSSSSSFSFSSSPWPSDIDNMMFGDQPHNIEDDNEDEDGEKYVDSYPLELCRLDYECRSGRTCVQGVCKCFTASFCAGHYKPVCGSDGVEYPSHCELHRTSCVKRVRIRIDHTGRCFKHEIEQKAKESWLMMQERLLQEDKDMLKAQQQKQQQHENYVHIPQDQIKEFPNAIDNGEKAPSTTTTLPEAKKDVEQKQETDKASSPKEVKTTIDEDSLCTWNEMARFKEDLLMYHCRKFIEPNCKLEVKTDRQYLSMLMFSYYDRNFDFFLDADELKDKERDEHFSHKIIKNCHLKDFVKFADTDSIDERLTVSEFTQSYVLPKPSSSTPSNVEVVSTLASAGDGLELKCGLKANHVIWKRYGMQLEDDNKNHKLMVFDDGALFFSKLSLHHIGNYTCIDTLNQKNAQVHRLNIQTTPIISMSPPTQNDLAGSDVELRCHAEGVPKPDVAWKRNGKDLLNSRHVAIYTGREHIVVHNAQPGRDSGKYGCRAHSQAGTAEQSSVVNIHAPISFPAGYEMQRNEGTFLVFHDHGVTAYDPLTCLARHKVKADFGNFKFIPDAMDAPLTLCKKNKSCQWADAVTVGSEFVYVSQPDQNRVVIVDAKNYWNPLQVIDTDHRPEKLQYVPQLDQVWVLCRSQNGEASDKTIVVIRDASQHIQHRSVHTRPVGNHFDTVEDLFIAPPNDLRHQFDHGYVTHAGKFSLSQINLEDMSYTRSIDLGMYGCTPVTVAFVPLGGHIVIECVFESSHQTLQIVMDYLTSAIVSATSISGKPLVSPDSRHMITVDKKSGKVVVASVSDEGQMETTYEVTVSAHISDVSFVPSTYHHGYDLILTSADDDDLIVMNLVTGKVEKMAGSSQLESSQTYDFTPRHRKIVAGDPMSVFVMTPSKSSLNIIDFKFKTVECQFTELSGDDNVMVHIPSPRVTN